MGSSVVALPSFCPIDCPSESSRSIPLQSVLTMCDADDCSAAASTVCAERTRWAGSRTTLPSAALPGSRAAAAAACAIAIAAGASRQRLSHSASHSAKSVCILPAKAFSARPMRAAAACQMVRNCTNTSLMSLSTALAGTYNASELASPSSRVVLTQRCRLPLQSSSRRAHIAPQRTSCESWPAEGLASGPVPAGAARVELDELPPPPLPPLSGTPAARSTSAVSTSRAATSSEAVADSAIPQPQTSELAPSPMARSAASDATRSAAIAAAEQRSLASLSILGSSRSWCRAFATVSSSALASPSGLFAAAVEAVASPSSHTAMISSSSAATARCIAERPASSSYAADWSASSASTSPRHRAP